MKSRNVPRDPINLDAKKRNVSMKYPEGGFFRLLNEKFVFKIENMA